MVRVWLERLVQLESPVTLGIESGFLHSASTIESHVMLKINWCFRGI
jgi:hypothetical protein